MKYFINGKKLNVKEFIAFCGAKLPASEGYNKLLTAAINCPSSDDDYITLNYYIHVFEEQAKKKGIEL